MRKRLAQNRLRRLWQQFPAVLILGARQAGKTTLARTAFPTAAYCGLEDPMQRHPFAEEPTFLVRRLPPYHRNVGKRLVKAAKVYLRDTGLLHRLLNLSTLAELENHPIRGASRETFVLEDLIRREKLTHPQSQYFFWRTAAGAELDLVIERGPERFGFEIKAGSGEKTVDAHKVAAALADVGAGRGWVLVEKALSLLNQNRSPF